MLSNALKHMHEVALGWFTPKSSYTARQATASESEFDITLIWVVVMLLALGLLMVYSSSIASASEAKFTRGSATYF
ncbi:MAG: hypothetical protein ACRCWJ_10980, partial [Casimicrobium sp.]